MTIYYENQHISRSIILTAVILAVHQTAFAQMILQSMLGHRGYQYHAIYQRNFSAGSNFSYYGMLDVNAAYHHIGQTQFDFFQSFQYQVIENAGLAFGTTFTNDDLLPHAGLYWGIENSALDLSVMPSIAYSLPNHTLGFDLELYFEKYWGQHEKWRPYSWLIVNGGTFGDRDLEMSLLGLVGLSYRKKLQFGLGAGLTNASDEADAGSNFGLVISYKFI